MLKIFVIKNLIKYLLYVFYLLIITEVISFVFTKLQLFTFNQTPAIYLKDQIHIENWRTEKEIWGAWHKKDKVTRHTTRCFDATYVSNEIGARDRSFQKFKNLNDNIILLGDSFAEGWGVEKNKTFEYLLERKINKNILNFGSSNNFGPLQYYLILKNLAHEYEYDKKIILFLPANDFTDNDFEYWKINNQFFYDNYNARYRPYYDNNQKIKFHKKSKKRNSLFQTQNDSSFSFKTKIFLKKTFWTTNLIMEIRLIFNKIKKKNKKNNQLFSPYYDQELSIQKKTLFFLEKTIFFDDKKTILISIPSFDDLIYQTNKKKPYWIKYLEKLDNENINFKFIDLMEFDEVKNRFNEIFNKCDGHWNKIGNKIVSEIIFDEKLL